MLKMPLRPTVENRVDNYILTTMSKEIKNELEERNEWMGEVKRVHKFPRGNIIKITLDETNKAKKSPRIWT